MTLNKDLKTELSQFSSLQSEIKILEDQLQSLKWQRDDVNGKIKTDSVKGSTPNFPYILHNITVKGLSDEELGQKYGISESISAVRKQLTERRLACIKEYKRLNDFITSIEDSQMRQILTLRYVYGNEWKDVAAKIGGNNTEDGVRKSHDRFLEKY
jgi:hypothetical protein